MSQNKINHLKNRIFKKSGTAKTGLTDVIGLIKEFGCLPEIIGREYEARSPEGDLLFTLKQKPIKLKQLNNLLKELDTLNQIESENAIKNKGRLPKKLGRRM